MKTVSRFASRILAAGLLAGSPAVMFAADPPPTQPAPESKLVVEQQADARAREAISLIEKASDPSTVVEAYARADDQNSLPLKQAFVKRMVALGVPELAEAQARNIALRAPDDGLAWAVVAFMDARRKHMPNALNGIVNAARSAADDPFVQRTAAQIIAYFDVYGDRNIIAPVLRDSIEKTRTALIPKPNFAQTYRRAKQAYSQAAARLTLPTTRPADAVLPPAEPYAAEPVDPYLAEPSVVYNDTSSAYAAPYPDPFAYDDYAANPWWPSSWWWDPGIVVVDGNFFHDRFEHRFDDRDGRFDGFHGVDDRDDRRFDEARSPDNQEFRGGSGEFRGMRFERPMPVRPSAPSFRGFSGEEGGRSFGSPVRGESGGRMGGGGGRGGGGGGHR